MYLRSACAIACAALLAVSPLAGQNIAAGDSARVETVRRLIVVTKVEEFHQQMLNMIADQYAKVPAIAPYAEAYRAFLAKHASFEASGELIRFYESPLGQRAVTAMPLVSARLSQIASDRMATLLPELMRQAGLPPAPPKP